MSVTGLNGKAIVLCCFCPARRDILVTFYYVYTLNVVLR